MGVSTGNKIEIRIATAEDAEQALAIYAPYVRDTAVTFEWEVPTLNEFRERILHTLEKYPYVVAECEGQIVGYAYASPFRPRKAYDWAIETAIYVSGDQRRAGVGRKLYEALEEILKAQGILSANACIAYSEIEDERLTKNSFKFHEHMGYKTVGQFHNCGYKFGTWYDVLWVEKMLGPHLSGTPEPRKFSALSSDELEILIERINS